MNRPRLCGQAGGVIKPTFAVDVADVQSPSSTVGTARVSSASSTASNSERGRWPNGKGLSKRVIRCGSWPSTVTVRRHEKASEKPQVDPLATAAW